MNEFVIVSRVADASGVLGDKVADESKATGSATEAMVDLERRAEGFGSITGVEIKFVQVEGETAEGSGRGFEIYAHGRLRARYWISARAAHPGRREASWPDAYFTGFPRLGGGRASRS